MLRQNKKYKFYFLLGVFLLVNLFVGKKTQAEKIIPDQDLIYLGAFKVPHDGGSTDGMWWGFASGGLTFNPNGNGGTGSLFGIGKSGVNTSNFYNYVSEINIPAPVNSKDLNDLPTASFLQNGTWGEISGGLVGVQDADVRQKVTGITYIPKQGSQNSDKIYWCSIYDYQPQNNGIDSATVGMSDANLLSPNSKGRWALKYDSDGTNIPAAYSTKWMLTIPKTWADTYLGGKYIGIGRDAIGQTGGNAGYGASLYAFAPNTTDIGPSSGTALEAKELLRFPNFNPLERNHAVSDWAGGGTWVTNGTKAALIFSYVKSMRTDPNQPPFVGGGDYPYVDYKYPSCLNGGNFCWPETQANTYQGNESDVFGYPYVAQLKFFDPDELAFVAQGTKQPWEIKPYANYQIEKYMFRPQGATKNTPGWTTYLLGGIAYDSENEKIYVEELNADSQMYPVIHVFQIQNNSNGNLVNINPTIPSNIRNIGANVSWEASIDSNGSSSNMLYIVFKWFGSFTSPDINHFSYPGMWRPVASTTNLTWTDPAYTIGDQYNVTAYDAYMNPSNILSASQTCNDEIKNGNEAGIDCGGSCQICNSKNYSTSDFTSLISNWLHLGNGNVSDINADNIVNAKDLGMMMSKWN